MGYQKNIVKSKSDNDEIKSFFDLNSPETVQRHIRFDMQSAFGLGHPQMVMSSLGIIYEQANPQSILDQWEFYNCRDIPEVLPPYLKEFNTQWKS